ncbi:MAG: rod shape-determining protein MreC [Clostridia bacterium]|nr:rod shape-determining protein MreC [Clostridia bacterium]
MKKQMLKRTLKFIFVIIIFVCIGMTNGKNRNTTVFESLVSNLITLPQKITNNINNWASKDKENIKNIEKLTEQNEKLAKENEELQRRMLDYEVLLSENIILKQKSQIEGSYPDYDVVVANVIYEPMNNWEEVYVIDKGSKDGVKPNMTVITTEGLVGYIESTTESTAKLISILDAGNSVSSRSTRTRDAVICKGNISLKDEEKLKIAAIPIGVEFVEGDKIETSGMGGVYPKGIAIGEIKEFIVKKNPTENEAILKTYVDFSKLETVAIIVK